MPLSSAQKKQMFFVTGNNKWTLPFHFLDWARFIDSITNIRQLLHTHWFTYGHNWHNPNYMTQYSYIHDLAVIAE